MRHHLGELDRLALRLHYGSVDPIAAIALPKEAHDNNYKKKNKIKCWHAIFFFFSSFCHNAKEAGENTGYHNDGFMTTADAFFCFVNQKF